MDIIPLNVQIYRCYHVVFEMLEQRGYDTHGLRVPTKDEINVNITSKFCEPLRVEHATIPGMVIEVYFLLFNSWRKDSIRSFMKNRYDDIWENEFQGKSHAEKMALLSKRTIVMIVKDVQSENNLREVDEFYQSKKLYVQLFHIESLMFNVTRHELVPLHERLHGQDTDTSQEIAQVMSEFSLRAKSELPIISHRDPPAMFIGLRPREICKITRFNETSGKYVVYRYCK